MMQRLIVILSLLFSSHTFSKEPESPPVKIMTPIQVNELYDLKNNLPTTGIVDFIAREEKIKTCIDNYIQKRAKPYARIPQTNLYDMIHNFGRIVSRIYGDKAEKDETPHEEKIEALAQIQCDAYYSLGVLK